jgi:hypothetical protein
MTKTLYHVTRRVWMPSIETSGLMVRFARGKMRGVWLCDADRLPWAVKHIAEHHGCNQADMSILHVNVNGMGLRNVRKGVYVSGEDVPRSRLFDCNYYALGDPE